MINHPKKRAKKGTKRNNRLYKYLAKKKLFQIKKYQVRQNIYLKNMQKIVPNSPRLTSLNLLKDAIRVRAIDQSPEFDGL